MMNNYFQQLREKAEARLHESSSETDNPSSDQINLYYTELEIQHEELQRAYQELNQLYENYWSLYEFAPCGYVELNPKGIITEINRQGRALLRNIAGSLRNIGFSRFIIKEHQSFFFAALSQAKQTGEKQSLELQFLSRDHPKDALWIHLDVQVCFKDDGELEKYDITLTDVTKDKEADIARERAKRLQLITDSVQGCIAYVDASQCYQFVNKTHQQWLGRQEEEFLGKSVAEVLGKEWHDHFSPLIEQVLQGEMVKCEDQFPYQYRELRDVSITLVPDFASTREVEGYYVLMTDITDSKKMTRQLQAQEAFLRSIYDGVEQAIFVVDVSETGEFYWADFNAVSERLMRMSRIEVKGQPLEAAFHPELASQVRDRYETCLARGQSLSYEECIWINDEKTCWLMTLTPLRQEDGRIYRIVGTGVNIDDRKQLEATLKEQAERERLINTITYAIRQSLDLQEVVDKTVTTLLEVFEVEQVLLGVYAEDETDSNLVRVATKTENYWSTHIGDYNYFDQLFQETEVVVIDDLKTAEGCCFSDVEARSLLLGGIYYHQTLKGVIGLKHQQYDWSEKEKNLLKAVADQIAIALQQAQLYKQLNQELTERNHLQNQLRYDATHDRLTGLPNRYLLIERLNEMIQFRNSEEDVIPFTVLFLDLNGFKYVNDTFGHNIGDQLLINVTLRLQNCLREEDMIARFGGDEFVILLERLPEKECAIEVANRIHQVLDSPININDIEVQVGTSIGIVYDNQQYTNSDPILRDADIAMYESKNQGVGYIIFNETNNMS